MAALRRTTSCFEEAMKKDDPLALAYMSVVDVVLSSPVVLDHLPLVPL